MAFDTDKLRSHLKESGLFSDAEIEAEVLSAQKDAKAEERRSLLNTQKVEAPVVANSSPAATAVSVPAAAVPPTAPPITAATTPAQLFDMRPKGTPVERIGSMMGEAGTAATNTASNATQDSLDYARNAIANNPDLPAYVAGGAGLAYLGKKALDGSLFDTLGSKMSATPAQPMVGGAGPRVTPPAASPIQNWDIHSDPSFGNFLGDATAPAAAPATPAAAPAATTAPAAPVNTKLQELQARAAAGIPTSAAPAVSAAPAPPVMSERQSAIAEADARLAAVRNSPEVQNSVWGALSSNETPAEADARKSIGQAKLAAAVEAHRQEVSAAYKLSEAPAIQEVGPPEFTGPRRPVTPTPSAALASTTAPVVPVVPPTGELRTGAGLPAYAGEGKPRERFPKEFKTIADVPKGYAFIPGAGPGTNTMRNLVGQEGYNEAVRLHGGPFGSHQEAVDFMDKYNAETRIGPPADRELRKSLGLSMPENTKGIPFKVPKAKVAGVAGAIVAMSDVAKAAQGDTSGLKETAFNVALGAIPEVNVAAQALMGTNVGAPTVRSDPFAEVLQRPGVKQVLQNMSQTMSPSEFNVARDQYLSKLSSFPEYNSLRFTKPVIGSNQPINRRTLLPVAPPR